MPAAHVHSDNPPTGIAKRPFAVRVYHGLKDAWPLAPPAYQNQRLYSGMGIFNWFYISSPPGPRSEVPWGRGRGAYGALALNGRLWHARKGNLLSGVPWGLGTGDWGLRRGTAQKVKGIYMGILTDAVAHE